MTDSSLSTRPILLVGGGTGGHIFPLVAIGEELKSQKIPFIFVGSPGSREEEIITDLGWDFRTVSAGKWRRYSNWSSFSQNLADIGRNIRGIFQAIRLIKKTKARLVFSKGGYVSLPVVIAAKLTRRPLVIHESDAVMGLTNKFASRFARRVLTNFAPAVFSSADSRFNQVGMPIRRALRRAAALKTPQKIRPLVLILPGSQGSMAINNYLKTKLPQLLAIADVVHLTGEKDYPVFQALHQTMSEADQLHYKPYSFIDRELPYYFQMADLLVSRASATTTAEAALFGKAVYLIPLPTAAGNHQLVNAKILEAAGAAIVKQQYQLTPELFLRDVEDLVKNPEQLKHLGQTLHNYFNEDATLTKIIREITNAKS